MAKIPKRTLLEARRNEQHQQLLTNREACGDTANVFSEEELKRLAEQYTLPDTSPQTDADKKRELAAKAHDEQMQIIQKILAKMENLAPGEFKDRPNYEKGPFKEE